MHWGKEGRLVKTYVNTELPYGKCNRRGEKRKKIRQRITVIGNIKGGVPYKGMKSNARNKVNWDTKTDGYGLIYSFPHNCPLRRTPIISLEPADFRVQITAQLEQYQTVFYEKVISYMNWVLPQPRADSVIMVCLSLVNTQTRIVIMTLNLRVDNL